MANDKLIIYLIVLFVVYKLFINKESFRFATGQINYGKIDLYCADITTTPVQKYVVTPDISSIGTVNLQAKSSSIVISDLASNFNPNTLSVTSYTVSDWTNNKVLINNKFGDNIKVEYNRRTNRLELSGLTYANLGYNVKGFPGRPGAPVLAATLHFTWIN
jgi:hypothetical protein